MKEKIKDGLIGTGFTLYIVANIVCSVLQSKKEDTKVKEELKNLPPVSQNATPQEKSNSVLDAWLIGAVCYSDNSR